MMTPSRFLSLLLIISALLLLSPSQGYGRRIKSTVKLDSSEDGMWRERAMVEMDYKEPGPNPNPRGGFPFSPPPPEVP